LIKQGAVLIERADDILHELSLPISHKLKELQPELPLEIRKTLPDLTEDEQRIYDLIDTQPIHIDEITLRSQLPSGIVSARLMMLEMKNVIRQFSGKMFVRI
jgi:DNA processing protein